MGKTRSIQFFTKHEIPRAFADQAIRLLPFSSFISYPIQSKTLLPHQAALQAFESKQALDLPLKTPTSFTIVPFVKPENELALKAPVNYTSTTLKQLFATLVFMVACYNFVDEEQRYREKKERFPENKPSTLHRSEMLASLFYYAASIKFPPTTLARFLLQPGGALAITLAAYFDPSKPSLTRRGGRRALEESAMRAQPFLNVLLPVCNKTPRELDKIYNNILMTGISLGVQADETMSLIDKSTYSKQPLDKSLVDRHYECMQKFIDVFENEHVKAINAILKVESDSEDAKAYQDEIKKHLENIHFIQKKLLEHKKEPHQGIQAVLMKVSNFADAAVEAMDGFSRISSPNWQ